MKDIWIFAQQTHGIIHPVYFELLGKAKELYPDERLTAVVLGNGNDAVLPVLLNSGASTVISAEHEKLARYHPDYYALTLAELARSHGPEVILIGATAAGSELAPTVAAKLGTGLAAHCTDLCLGEDGELVTIIPAFGGKLLGEILVPEKRPVMASVKPGVFSRRELQKAEDASVICESASFLHEYTSRIELIGIKVKEEAAEQGKLEDAEIVVCAGLGIGSQENWEKINRLASLLNGSVGYTRPVVDMGYIDHENAMIGASGKTIHPKLYLGFGVSGATHHVCGMKDSGTIISVNMDEKAAVFDVSDYKLIGDCGQVLDELLALLEKR